MDAHFQVAFERTVGHEGRHSNDPRDSGGETMFGITFTAARANGYAGPMKDMPLEVARRIYEAEYWVKLGCGTIAVRSPVIAYEVFDSGVNCGITVAGRWFQRSLNALNQGAHLYSDVPVDGALGVKTFFAYARYLDARGRKGETVLLRMLNSIQGAHYVTLAETRPKDEAFVFGWFLNRVDIPARTP